VNDALEIQPHLKLFPEEVNSLKAKERIMASFTSQA
jgi:hypothetical protein